LVLSTGTASGGAVTSNANASLNTQQYGGTKQPAANADLAASSKAAGYSQTLWDQVTLQFDITPNATGPIAFQYVFGSESIQSMRPVQVSHCCWPLKAPGKARACRPC